MYPGRLSVLTWCCTFLGLNQCQHIKLLKNNVTLYSCSIFNSIIMLLTSRSDVLLVSTVLTWKISLGRVEKDLLVKTYCFAGLLANSSNYGTQRHNIITAAVKTQRNNLILQTNALKYDWSNHVVRNFSVGKTNQSCMNCNLY